MDYNELGRSGLKVSGFGLGVMTFGGQTPEDDAMRQMDMAYDAGITFFDSAENYPTPTGPETQGESERILGRWIAERGLHGKVVVATKVAGPGNAAGDMTHIRGAERCLDRANITAAVDASLARLGTDCIDLYQVHWPERPITTLWRSRWSVVPDPPGLIPIEETLGVLADLVREGKIRAFGVSNESPWGLMRYLAIAKQRGQPRVSSIQYSYSLLDRYFELGLAEIAMREQVGLIGYSPLARGLLTGKHLTGEGSARLSENKRRAVSDYVALARENGLEPAQMALAFARQQPFMASVLMAASSVSQLSTNIAAIEVTLSKDLVKAINRIHDSNPNPK
ncbi:MAG: aldo/keto reductase [Novosphingobium sp.]|nr:aldo/keto reductase [Novosphingobium sp.]